jgi:hypothetical protein
MKNGWVPGIGVIALLIWAAGWAVGRWAGVW